MGTTCTKQEAIQATHQEVHQAGWKLKVLSILDRIATLEYPGSRLEHVKWAYEQKGLLSKATSNSLSKATSNSSGMEILAAADIQDNLKAALWLCLLVIRNCSDFAPEVAKDIHLTHKGLFKCIEWCVKHGHPSSVVLNHPILFPREYSQELPRVVNMLVNLLYKETDLVKKEKLACDWCAHFDSSVSSIQAMDLIFSQMQPFLGSRSDDVASRFEHSALERLQATYLSNSANFVHFFKASFIAREDMHAVAFERLTWLRELIGKEYRYDRDLRLDVLWEIVRHLDVSKLSDFVWTEFIPMGNLRIYFEPSEVSQLQFFLKLLLKSKMNSLLSYMPTMDTAGNIETIESILKYRLQSVVRVQVNDSVFAATLKSRKSVLAFKIEKRYVGRCSVFAVVLCQPFGLFVVEPVRILKEGKFKPQLGKLYEIQDTQITRVIQ